MLRHKIRYPEADVKPEDLKTDCPVCFEAVFVTVSLKCGHAACLGCWDRWRTSCETRSAQLTCPLCRNPIGPLPHLQSRPTGTTSTATPASFGSLRATIDSLEEP